MDREQQRNEIKTTEASNEGITQLNGGATIFRKVAQIGDAMTLGFQRFDGACMRPCKPMLSHATVGMHRLQLKPWLREC